MKSKPILNRLSPNVVNQIAAGEVVERPSSIVKELVDNSIDAGANKITIKVVGGGMDLIEVTDNGIGIPSENLQDIFDAHTTTKIKDINDLNDLMSMGFRGEALSTITSISKVNVISKFQDSEIGNSISIDGGKKFEIKKAPIEEGTSISVKDIFYNIPARRKYLKTAQTEYRKIYEILVTYFLIYPNIHFILEKDAKQIHDLPAIPNSKAGEIQLERVKEIWGEKTSENMLEIFFEGSGISVQGLVGHPNSHKSRESKQVIYINNRAIKEKGIVRSVYEGFSRFLPFGEKVPFILNIKINPDLVDVNVHPRKEEVRFENPYRVYSAVEAAIKHTLEKELSFNPKKLEQQGLEFENSQNIDNNSQTNKISEIRKNINSRNTNITSSSKQSKEYSPRNIYFGKDSTSVRDSIAFSKELLDNNPSEYSDYREKEVNEESFDGEVRNIFQIFNKYIAIEFDNKQFWIIDQHAAAERINFEKLQNTHKDQNKQNLLVPTKLELTEEEKAFVSENVKFFSDMGFEISENKKDLEITSVPAEFTATDFEKMFDEIFEITDNPKDLSKNFEKRKDDILATMSCHASIRSGQALDRNEMLNMYNELKECKNPYSCPHGRPAIWKMTLDQIDSNFERTY